MWPLVLISSLGCYAEKLLGLLVPARWGAGTPHRGGHRHRPGRLARRAHRDRHRRAGTSLVLDARLAGVAAAAVLVLTRRGFLVVLLGAITTTALIRLAS